MTGDNIISTPVHLSADELERKAEKIAELVYYVELANARINDMRKDLKNICWHPSSTEQSENYPGSYYDEAEYHTWDECVVCGSHTSKIRIETGGYG